MFKKAPGFSYRTGIIYQEKRQLSRIQVRTKDRLQGGASISR